MLLWLGGPWAAGSCDCLPLGFLAPRQPQLHAGHVAALKPECRQLARRGRGRAAGRGRQHQGYCHAQQSRVRRFAPPQLLTPARPCGAFAVCS